MLTLPRPITRQSVTPLRTSRRGAASRMIVLFLEMLVPDRIERGAGIHPYNLRFARIRGRSWESASDLLVQVSGQVPEVEKSLLHLRQR